jgi:hypothetical protein
VGVNIYRSDGSDRGTYHRLNSVPIGSQFYRDFTENQRIVETISWDTAWIFKGDGPNNRRWEFRTRYPIVKNETFECVWADSPFDVQLTIDGQAVPIASVFGRNGQVILSDAWGFNPVTEQKVAPVYPTEDSVVLLTYYSNKNYVKSGALEQRPYYLLTTVVYDPNEPTGLAETPLKYAKMLTQIETESLDYMWREAIRRNRWILEQGGERVKFFIRKTSGVSCSCTLDDMTLEYTGQPRNRCQLCFGTGYLQGYEGPYEGIIAPEETDRRIEQTERGRVQEASYEVWTGPSPVLTQRDFLVRQQGERWSVGACRRPSNRGNLMQQHFTIGYLQEGDIRYQVPVDGFAYWQYPENRTTIETDARGLVYPYNADGPVIPLNPDEHGPQIHEEGTDYKATPMISDKCNIDDTREERGRTTTWSNQNY